jgi:hypothetical protein
VSTPCNHVHFWLKDQLLEAFDKWGVYNKPPRKGEQVIVGFPPPAVFNVARITRHSEKSTYGKPLYKVEITTEESLAAELEGGAE